MDRCRAIYILGNTCLQGRSTGKFEGVTFEKVGLKVTANNRQAKEILLSQRLTAWHEATFKRVVSFTIH